MNRVEVQESAVIDAPADRIYGLLADYRSGHPRILPPRYFSHLSVEQGGVGAGTVIRFQMHVLGSTHEARMEVSEPQPGRVLVEQDPTADTVTTFTLRPLDTGRTQVTIATSMAGRAGVLGMVERMAASAFLRKVYAEELTLLAKVAAERPAGS
jgi:hypothetical protein